jgi:hypothetical protein
MIKVMQAQATKAVSNLTASLALASTFIASSRECQNVGEILAMRPEAFLCDPVRFLLLTALSHRLYFSIRIFKTIRARP